jgi:CBS domain-containing protein
MWEHDCGCVPVVDGNESPIGMITDRDVCMAALTQSRTLHEMVVESARSRGAVTVHEHDVLESAERLMSQHQLRRLPVVDDRGRIVGLLSIHDLAHKAEASDDDARRVNDTLARICAPRGGEPPRAETGPSDQVEDVMTFPVHSCTVADTLVRPAQLMWDHDCGAIPVTRRGDCVAMVTDRDICMAAYLQGKRLADICVVTAASHRVCTVGVNDSIELAHEIMRMHRIRRLPVVDHGHNLVGIVSLADIARRRSTSASTGEALNGEMLTRTLARIGHWHGTPTRHSTAPP